MRRHHLPILATIAASVLLFGCGGSSPSASTSAETAAAVRSDRAMVQFAGCMRTHGVDIPDPYHRPGHSGLTLELPEGLTGMPAYKTCQRYLAQIIATKEAGARAATAGIRLALVRYAQCMRTHGIPMHDPNAVGQIILGNIPGTSSSVGRYTPSFHAADHDCRYLLPVTIPDNGTGP